MKNLIFLLIFTPCLGWSGGENTGEFVKLGGSVRAIGMGNAYVGVGEGILSLNYNPAGLGKMTNREILLGYTRHFADIPLSSLSYGQPFLNGAFALNLLLMNTSAGEEVTDLPTGKDVNVSCRLMGLSYAKKISQNLSLGGSIKQIAQDYAGYKGSKFSYDLGILGEFSPAISFGFSLNNLGGNTEIDNVKNSIPFNIKIGIGFKITEKILMASDIEKPNDSNLKFCVGSEYKLIPNIDIRGGYNSLYGYSIGFGVRSRGTGLMQNVLAQIDYAYIYNPDLEKSHRVSLLTRF